MFFLRSLLFVLSLETLFLWPMYHMFHYMILPTMVRICNQLKQHRNINTQGNIIFMAYISFEYKAIFKPGHGARSHFSTSLDFPSQGLPPKAKLIKISRVLDLKELDPHVALHSVTFQVLHIQSTKNEY